MKYDLTKGFSQDTVTKEMYTEVEGATNVSRGISLQDFTKLLAYIDLINCLKPTDIKYLDTLISEVSVHPILKELIYPMSVRLKEGDFDWEDVLLRPDETAIKKLLPDASYSEFNTLQNKFAKSFRGKYDRVSLKDIRKNVSIVNVIDRSSVDGYVISPQSGVTYVPTPISKDFSDAGVIYCYDVERLFSRYWIDLINSQNASRE